MKRDKRIVHANVTDLPADLRQVVEQMLRDGATFEDVVDAVEERGRDRVSLVAVENYFRSNLVLQHDRARRQLATAAALKKGESIIRPLKFQRVMPTASREKLG